MQLYVILAVLLPTFTHVTAILRGQVVRSPQNVPRKNRSGAHGRSLIYFNVICFFCEIIRRYLQKKITSCSPSPTVPFLLVRARSCSRSKASIFWCLFIFVHVHLCLFAFGPGFIQIISFFVNLRMELSATDLSSRIPYTFKATIKSEIHYN